MLLGVHPTRFHVRRPLRDALESFADRIDEIGVHTVWPMDQLRQIPVFGDVEDPVLEPYSLLSWLAARTRRVQLGVLVTAGSYRHPAILAKTVSTLDVLSGGRAWLGVGASWGSPADTTAGIPVSPAAERYQRVDELLNVCDALFRGDRRPITGTHFALTDPINSPRPLRRPPVLIGGSGERRTLPLVARRADACNFLERIGIDELARKVTVLGECCKALGRPAGDVLVTTFGRLGERDLAAATRRLTDLAGAGVDLAMVDLPDLDDASSYDYLAELVAVAAPLGRRLPDGLLRRISPTA